MVDIYSLSFKKLPSLHPRISLHNSSIFWKWILLLMILMFHVFFLFFLCVCISSQCSPQPSIFWQCAFYPIFPIWFRWATAKGREFRVRTWRFLQDCNCGVSQKVHSQFKGTNLLIPFFPLRAELLMSFPATAPQPVTPTAGDRAQDTAWIRGLTHFSCTPKVRWGVGSGCCLASSLPFLMPLSAQLSCLSSLVGHPWTLACLLEHWSPNPFCRSQEEYAPSDIRAGGSKLMTPMCPKPEFPGVTAV